MGVLMQAFYWDCPRVETKEFKWWIFIAEKMEELHKVGFSALWLPPACKAANLDGPSMGYDPYDYYDLGDIDQRVQCLPGLVQELIWKSLFKLFTSRACRRTLIWCLIIPMAQTKKN